MPDIVSPADVIAELNRLRDLQGKGVEAMYAAEIRLAECEQALDTIEASAFLKANGTVADRERLAKLESTQARLERDVARAEMNRVKTKLRAIEQAFMAISVIGRQIELEWKR